jgi:hypothetical protein
MNMLLLYNLNNNLTPFTPTKLLTPPALPMNLEHYAMPMVHPMTGEKISSYKKTDERPSDCRNMANSLRKRFWRDVSR